MKNAFRATALMAMLAISSCSEPTSVVWTEGPVDTENGKGTYTIEIINAPKGDNWSLWFSAEESKAVEMEGSEGTVSNVCGTLHRAVPVKEHGKNVTFLYYAYPLPNHGWAPETFTLDVAGKEPVELDAEYFFQPAEEVEDFEFTAVEVGPEDIIPALKNVKYLDGNTVLDPANVEYKICNEAGHQAGWYRIVLKDDKAKAEATDEDGLWYAKVTLENISENIGCSPMRSMVIEDYPDLQHRGLMLDLSRNFTEKDDVLRLIDMLARYKVNVLHLHLTDDEGWRLEIEDLPELTSFSAYHELPEVAEDGSLIEKRGLVPSAAGTFSPDAKSSSNGYLTKADFIEILKFAKERHIRVIPEMDMPGHARAAVKAMEKYAERTADTSYLLTEASDSSAYCAIGNFSDNSINIALPSTYKFIEKFFDTLVSYYNEADAVLETVHMGGDEVDSTAWIGSPSCKKLMQENGWNSADQLVTHFINRVMDIAQERGLKIAGWQEICLLGDEALQKRMMSELAYVNCWRTSSKNRSDEFPYQFANNGLNIVLSNMNNTYADLAYNRSKYEEGLVWGGYVDERRAFSLNPFNIYKSIRWDNDGKMVELKGVSEGKTQLKDDARQHILGTQIQLWTETTRDFDDVTYYLFPKILGALDRAWNAYPVWKDTETADDPLFIDDFNRFYSSVVMHEYPHFDGLGIKYRKHHSLSQQ